MQNNNCLLLLLITQQMQHAMLSTCTSNKVRVKDKNLS